MADEFSKPEKRKRNTLKIKDAYIFILSGISLILLSLIFLGNIHIKEISLQFLSHIGIGLLVIGILSILIDFSHWTDYFEKRLSNIVVEKRYLEKLDQSALINLQTEVLKAYYKNDEIGGADGFLNFYQKNIQALVSTPFRINVNLNLQIDFYKENKDKFIVRETMSWICKSNGGKIQERINWIPEDNEFDEVFSYEVKLQHRSLITNENPSGTVIFDFDTLRQQFSSGSLGFSLPLPSSYSKTDELYIVIKSEYIIPKERFLGWRMTFPTRRMCLMVQYPKDLDIVTELFFNANNIKHSEENSGSGVYFLNIEDWIMTDEGLTLQLLSPVKKQ